MRILVSGPREGVDKLAVFAALNKAYFDSRATEEVTIVHGDCPDGVDAHASEWVAMMRADGWHVLEEKHPADWDFCGPDCPSRPHRYKRKPGDRFHPGVLPDYCPKAGPRRNAYMTALGADECITFLMQCTKTGCRIPGHHWTHGTANCQRLAEKAGIPIRPVRISVATRKEAS